MSFFLFVVAYILLISGGMLLVLAWPKAGGLLRNLAELTLGGSMVMAAGFVLGAALL